jgi:hypothetical protein
VDGFEGQTLSAYMLNVYGISRIVEVKGLLVNAKRMCETDHV